MKQINSLKIDKLYKLQHHLGGIQMDPMVSPILLY